MNKKTKKKLASVAVGVVAFGALLLLDNLGYINIEDYINADNTQNVTETSNKTQSATNNNTIQNIDELYEVVRVVDGDTIIINYNGTEERVRMIGIDTAESVHPDENKNTTWGKVASDYTKKMLTGKKVGIEFDVSQRDKYGRFLAYVYLDGKMYNKTLLEIGYAKLATYPPNVKYVDDFTALQKEARENKVGVWKD